MEITRMDRNYGIWISERMARGFGTAKDVSCGYHMPRSVHKAVARRMTRRALRLLADAYPNPRISAINSARASSRPSSRRLSFAGSTRFSLIHSVINMMHDVQIDQ